MDTIPAVFTVSLDAPAPRVARLRLQGHLDGAAALELLHRAAAVVRCHPLRLVIDLDGVSGFDAEATYAVVGCTRLARFLPEGVTVVAEQPTGRDLAERTGLGALA